MFPRVELRNGPLDHTLRAAVWGKEKDWDGNVAGDIAPDCPILGCLLRRIPLPRMDDGLRSFADIIVFRRRFDRKVFRYYREALRNESPDETPIHTEEQRGSSGADMSTSAVSNEPLHDEDFTFAARMALQLSARGLRDLQQEAYQRLRETPSSGSEKTRGISIELAVRMLKTSIDESTLPSWASEQLHTRIIRKDARTRWILDLRGNPIRPSSLTTLPDTLILQPSGKSWAKGVRTELQLRRITDINLELHGIGSNQRVPLPPAVAGWFMLLHDLLTFVERVSNPALDRLTPQDMMPRLVATRHEFLFQRQHGRSAGELIPLEFTWSLPPWDTFFDFFIFAAQWRAFLDIVSQFLRGREAPKTWHEHDSSWILRIILAAWVDNTCSVALGGRGQWSWDFDSAQDLPSILRCLDENPIEHYERCVRGRILKLYASIRPLGEARYGRKARAWAWLERILPLLLLPEYAPFDSTRLLAPSKEEQKQTKDWADLAYLWREQLEFLKATRRESVRRAAIESTRFLSLCMPWRKDGGAAAQEWLGSVQEDWFLAVDANRNEREAETLRNVTGSVPS